MTKIRELALLLTAYSYLKNQVELVDCADDKKDVSYIYTKDLVTKTWQICTSFKRLHHEALQETDIAMAKVEDYHGISVYVAGLELLAQHAEIKGKFFSVGNVDKIIHLQELALGIREPAMYEESIQFAEDYYKALDN